MPDALSYWRTHEHSDIARLAAARPAAVEDTCDAPPGPALQMPPDEAALLAPLVRRFEAELRAEIAGRLARLPRAAPMPAARELLVAAERGVGRLLSCDGGRLAAGLGGAMPVAETDVLAGRFEWGSARHVVHIYAPVAADEPAALVRIHSGCAGVAVYVTSCGCPRTSR